uniref:Uncharacterized protein n=1 Tax=Rhabditophanes sp. KR3021 TaxID=114890 RepID=A0AC35UFF5_9BILA
MFKTSPFGSEAPGTNNNRREYHIGFTSLNLGNLWDENDERYKCLCRMVHVKKAALHLAYAQMTIFMMFVLVVGYYYLMQLNGQLGGESRMAINAQHNSNFLFSFSAQIFFVILLIHGIKTEKRSLLIPYLIFTLICVLLGVAQLCSEFVGQPTSSSTFSIHNTSRAYRRVSEPFLAILLGVMIHVWCLSVIWRTYKYLGDKKMAKKIAEQLSTTQSAFSYPEFAYSGFPLNQPPPYADIVVAEEQRALYPAAEVSVIEQTPVQATTEERLPKTV